MDHDMRMYFHSGFQDQFLFQYFHIDSTLKMFSVCGFLFLMTILFEFVKYVRSVRCGCQVKRQNCSTENVVDQDNGTTLNLHNCYVGKLRGKRHRLIQAMLHLVQTSLGFVIMLSVMSFNMCIIFAILIGTAVGYYIFYRPYNEIESIDSCH